MLFVLTILALVIAAVDGQGKVVIQTDNEETFTFTAEEGLFGPALPLSGVAGILQRVYPLYPDPVCEDPAYSDCDFACGAVVPPNTTHYPKMLQFIALIQRSPKEIENATCGFETKVRNAQNAGYGSVIVYNNVPGEGPMQMQGDGVGGVNISSVFVSRESGRMMLDLLQTHDTGPVIAQVYPDVLMVTPFLFTFVAIVAGTSVIFTLFLFYRRHMLTNQRRKHKRMTKKQMMKLPVRSFKPEDAEETCVICLENFKRGSKIMILPCGHIYHKKCITTWLSERQRLCCICKRDPANPDGTENTPLLASTSTLSDSSSTSTLASDSSVSSSSSSSSSSDEAYIDIEQAPVLSINVADDDDDAHSEPHA